MTKQVQRRRGTATQHTSFTGAEGELSVNTTNKSVHVHDGSTAGGIELARKDGSNVAFTSGTLDGVTIGGTTAGAGTFTNLTATGTTTLAGASTSANITFGDNDKAIFGAGSDLQIYHDGSDSYISDVGTGNLRIRGTDITLQDADGNGYISMVDGGAGGTVYLKHLGSNVLTTTSTGIDVTGTVTADGLTVDGSSAGRVTSAEFKNNLNAGGTEVAINLANQGGTSNADVNLVAYRSGSNFGSDFYIETSDGVDGTNRKRLNVGEQGDISFYDSLGSSQSFFWDASAERLGIGTTGPAATIDVVGSGRIIQTNSTALTIRNQTQSIAGGNSTLKIGSTDTAAADKGGQLNFTANTTSFANYPVAGIHGYHETLGASNYSGYLSLFTTSTGGSITERMRIDSSGNVGVGTSSPSSYWANADDLVVATSGNTGISVVSGTTSLGYLIFADSTAGGDNTRGGLGYDHSTNNMLFRVNNDTKMTIDSSGNVGIKNSAMSSFEQVGGANLLVLGSGAGSQGMTIYSGNTGTGSIAFADGTTTSQEYEGLIQYNHGTNSMAFYSNHAERMRIDSSGRVLIGTTATTSGFNLRYGSAGDRVAEIKNTGGFGLSITPQIGGSGATTDIGLAAGESLSFSPNNTEAMRIDSSGNIGIGTNSPVAKLHVENGDIRIEKDTKATIGFKGHTAGSTALAFRDSNAGIDRMVINSSGNVGIGTDSPSNVLHVKGENQITLEDTSSGNIGQVYAANTATVLSSDPSNSVANSSIVMQVDGSEAMRIDSSGNVGIGTTSPTNKLHIKDSSSAFAFLDSSGDAMFALDGSNGDFAGGDYFTIQADSSPNLKITQAGTERMRIDSSGNLLVGTTTTDTTAAAGFTVQSDGQLYLSADSQHVATMTRLTNDGDILTFRRSAIGGAGLTTVGSIGTYLGDSYVGTGSAGLRFYDAGPAITPHNTTTNLGTDGTIDLGTSAGRFKDLYLSGGVYLGGTGSANHLDDYEEGTFTPTINNGTVSVDHASYVKIGHLVTVTVTLGNFSDATSGTLVCNNMPFVSKGGDAYQAHGAVMHQEFNIANAQGITAFMNDGTASLVWYANQGSSSWTAVRNSHIDTAPNAYLRTTITYRTT